MRILHAWYAAAVLAMVLTAASASGWSENSEPATHRVEIRQFKFVPSILEINPGDTIVWVNVDIVPHTVTALDGTWDSGNMDTDAEWRTTVTESMSEQYYCRYHPTMTGTLVIDIDHGSISDSRTDSTVKRARSGDPLNTMPHAVNHYRYAPDYQSLHSGNSTDSVPR